MARHSGLFLALAVGVALGSCSNSESPTEPVSRPSLTLSVTQPPVASLTGGVISVVNDSCGCVGGHVSRRDRGGPSETFGGSSAFGCGSTISLPLRSVGPRIGLTAFGHTASGQPIATNPVSVDFPDGYSGPVALTVRLSCMTR